MNLQLSANDLKSVSSVEIVVGDCLDVLRRMPAGSVQTVATSPPYYGAQDFGVAASIWGGSPGCRHRWEKSSKPARSPSSFCRRCIAWRGCLGLEPTYQLYIAHMVEIFREVSRVLRDDGTLWLNMGDRYATRRSGWSAARYKDDGYDHRFVDNPFDAAALGFKEKDLMGMPWRAALALQEAGWYLRRDIVWHKKNPMPETVYDRPTTAHEYVFLLTKSGNTLLWRHDETGIWVEDKPAPEWRWRHRITRELSAKPQVGKDWFRFNLWSGFDYYYDFEAIMEPSSPNSHARVAAAPILAPTGWDDGAGHHGSVHRLGRRKLSDYGNGTGTVSKQNEKFDAAIGTGGLVARRNKRSVWSIASQPFKEAHFATFPPALIEPCILAGCPAGGIVLDPFAGAGTTGLVAALKGRNSILIEKNRKYAKMAKARIAKNGRGCLVRLVDGAAYDFGVAIPAAVVLP
jgi:DNA modification methylase